MVKFGSNLAGRVPKAQKQAHERIIGERPVENADKILSLYEREVRVIVRGKAGAEVEFGNTVVLAENIQGVIVDYRLVKEQAPAESRLLMESIERVRKVAGEKLGAVVTDRGFASAANSAELKKAPAHDRGAMGCSMGRVGQGPRIRHRWPSRGPR